MHTMAERDAGLESPLRRGKLQKLETHRAEVEKHPGNMLHIQLPYVPGEIVSQIAERIESVTNRFPPGFDVRDGAKRGQGDLYGLPTQFRVLVEHTGVQGFGIRPLMQAHYRDKGSPGCSVPGRPWAPCSSPGGPDLRPSRFRSDLPASCPRRAGSPGKCGQTRG